MNAQVQQDLWILVGKTVGGPRDGAPRYHMADTPIGPASSPDTDQALTFTSREEACQSPGFRHWSSNMSPVLLSEARASLTEGAR